MYKSKNNKNKKQNKKQNENENQIFRGIINSTVFWIVANIVTTFFSSWKLFYWQGILYNFLTITMLIIGVFSIYNNIDLLNERINPGEGIKKWDKIYFKLYTPLFFITVILGSIDTGRLNFSPKMSVYIYLIAVLMYLTGQFIFIWARKTNKFFSSVARIQKERGHVVCVTGPYRFLRHPGYLGVMM